MIPHEMLAEYQHNLAEARKNDRGFHVFKKPKFEIGVHPTSYIDYECSFAAYHLSQLGPQRILDIGSYRQFIIGLLSHYQVTTIDVRTRNAISANENVLTCDAKNLDVPDNSFDAVVSLSAVEHFGLGRYGDEFDLDADKKACTEMVRVLRPGGRLIFTTTITRAKPSIAFNAHRIYDYDMIRTLCHDLVCIDEKFYSHRAKDFCDPEDVTMELGVWDVYCGCLEKGCHQ